MQRMPTAGVLGSVLGAGILFIVILRFNTKQNEGSKGREVAPVLDFYVPAVPCEGLAFVQRDTVFGLTGILDINKEAVGIDARSIRRLFGEDILRRLRLHVLLTKPTFAPVRLQWPRKTKPQFWFHQSRYP
jgi:hypothetical protein